MGKDKLAVLLRREDWQVSTSMVGRILTSLKIRGVLREPQPTESQQGNATGPVPMQCVSPRNTRPESRATIVQVDTLDVRPLPGVVLKHFTARDVVSRWDVLEVHTRATATTAKAFLDTLQDRLPSLLRLSRWTGAASSKGALSRPAKSGVLQLFVPASQVAQAQWPCGAGPADPYRGVL